MGPPARIAALFEAAWGRRDPSVEPELSARLAELTAAEDHEGVAWACIALARLAVIRTDLPAAADLLDRGLAVADDRLREVRAWLLSDLGSLMLEQDLWVDALSPLIAVSRMEAEFPVLALRARKNLGYCLLAFGDHRGAMERFQACLPASTGNDSGHAFLIYGMCVAALRAGDREVAEDAYRRLARITSQKPANHAVIEVLQHLAAGELAEGRRDWAQALVHGEAARPMAPHLGLSMDAGAARMVGRARAALGDRAGARAIADHVLGLPLGRHERGEALRWAADLARADGDPDRAATLLTEALALVQDDPSLGRSVARIMERAAEGLHQREVELSLTNEALARAYATLDRLRRQLELRVEERTRTLAEEVEIRRSAERQAVAANQAKSQFLANMSHELRTPLNAIIGYAELLGEELSAPHDADADAVRRSGVHLLELVDQVLDLTRIEAGHLDLRVAPVDLDRIADEVADEVEGQLRASGNRLARGGSAGGPFATDPLRVRQILRNLLGNAIRFTAGGEVTLHLTRSGDQLEIAVVDTGIGIAPADLERIFEPFEQADPTPTRRYDGTGLGLAICRQLAEALGGSISATSEVGRGSTFRVVLREA